jgi:hypothetical protein
LSYQWQKDTLDIPGANSSSYTIASTTTGDNGSYRVRVSNNCGAATSAAAALQVNACGCPGERGDANCSGVIDFFDIDPFLLALFDPPAYATAFCGGSICAADTDCSGLVDFFDIDSMLSCLFANCPSCP